MLATCTFWLVKADNILYISQTVYEAGRWPQSLYPGWLRVIMTCVVPVAFAVSVPAEAFVGRLSGAMLGTSAAVAVGMLLLARWFWSIGIRRYSGASA
jgi:ABC-2 type transport system permease protein